MSQLRHTSGDIGISPMNPKEVIGIERVGDAATVATQDESSRAVEGKMEVDDEEGVPANAGESMDTPGTSSAPTVESIADVAAQPFGGSAQVPAPPSSSSSSSNRQVRDPTARPCHKLSVNLINTYKHINRVYYEAKARRLREQSSQVVRNGVHNDGYDDQNYDYIVRGDEIFAERYILKNIIGKGSFGQVVCAYDQLAQNEVAIKIIKSRTPFRKQAQTEIDLLRRMRDRDPHDEWNVVKLLDNFEYRNHVCLVFEMLSYNLYELLKNTRFKGVSLNLIRKFSKQIVRSLKFLGPEGMDIVHCDLKPENILLRHPRRSAVKIIDFGSSCLRSRRQYTYIQSRFYRSPEVILGLPYDQKIDIWSLGCVLVEMHTGEPLFGGTDPLDQICKIVDVLGMPPFDFLTRSPERVRSQFFESICGIQPPSSIEFVKATASADCDTDAPCVVFNEAGNEAFVLKRFGRVSSGSSGTESSRERNTKPNRRQLADVIGVYSGGPAGRRRGEQGHGVEKYEEFLDYIFCLLRYDPIRRFSAEDATNHDFNASSNHHSTQTQPQAQVLSSSASQHPPAEASASSQSTAQTAGTDAATEPALGPQHNPPAPPGTEPMGEDVGGERGRSEHQGAQRMRSSSAPSSACHSNSNGRRYQTRAVAAAAASASASASTSMSTSEAFATEGRDVSLSVSHLQSLAGTTTVDGSTMQGAIAGGEVVVNSMDVVANAANKYSTEEEAGDHDTSMETE